MRRRRRNRSTWFPVLGTENPADPNASLSTVYWTFTDALADYTSDIDVSPLIPDDSSDPSGSGTAGETLRDYVEGQTCVIDRIVGKIACAAQQIQETESESVVTAVVACAAIAVIPTDEASGQPDISTQEYNPLIATNIDKPWLFRRTWTLGNNMGNLNNGFPVFTQPSSNEFFPGLLDGPHVDTKGVRRNIRKNERIYLVLASQSITPGQPTEDLSVFWSVDLRVIGRMQKAKNRGHFG